MENALARGQSVTASIGIDAGGSLRNASHFRNVESWPLCGPTLPCLGMYSIPCVAWKQRCS